MWKKHLLIKHSHSLTINLSHRDILNLLINDNLVDESTH